MRQIFHHTVLEELSEIADPAHTAVLVIDMQNDFCSPEGFFGRRGMNLTMIQAMVPKLGQFLATARSARLPVFFVQQTTAANGGSDSGAWLRLKTRGGSDGQYTVSGSWGHDIIDALQPTHEDVVLQKSRSSAFTNTDLAERLRALGIATLVITGTTTQGCVESTARDATFHDFYAVLPTDLVASTRADLHDASLLVQSVRHELTTSQELTELWRLERRGVHRNQEEQPCP